MNKLEFILDVFGMKNSGLADFTFVDRSVISNYFNKNVMPSKNARNNISIFFGANENLFDDDKNSKFIEAFIMNVDKEHKSHLEQRFISLNELNDFLSDNDTLVVMSPVTIPRDRNTNLGTRIRLDVFYKMEDNNITRDIVNRYCSDIYSLGLLKKDYYKSFGLNNVITLGKNKENNCANNAGMLLEKYVQVYRTGDTFYHQEILDAKTFTIKM